MKAHRNAYGERMTKLRSSSWRGGLLSYAKAIKANVEPIPMKKRMFTIQGKTYGSITDAAKQYNLTVKLVSRRLKAGWTAEQAVESLNLPRAASNAKFLQTSKGKFKSIREASKVSGVSEANINARLRLGGHPIKRVDFLLLLKDPRIMLGRLDVQAKLSVEPL